MAIKLETLINVLAINNGGIEIEPTDYIPLFASMVRTGLVPNHDTFRIVDLSLMYEKNEQISQLPSEETIRIAKDFHRKRLLGETDDKLTLELTREIQGVKLQIVDDLESTKAELSIEKQEKNRYKDNADKTARGLRENIKKNLDVAYKKRIRNNRLGFYLGLPLIILLICGIGAFIFNNYTDATNLSSYIISLITSALITILFIIFNAFPRINSLKKNKEKWIKEEIEKQIQEILSKE